MTLANRLRAIFGSSQSPTQTGSENHSGMLGAVTRAVGVDKRSLALLRVSLGVLSLLDLCARATDLQAHYGQLGVWPLVHAVDTLSEYTFSLHFANGAPLFQVCRAG
jgi:hypothetical protein